ncbi:MAG: hypothetical protein AAFX79_10860 [Planctomycetota bacterium]
MPSKRRSLRRIARAAALALAVGLLANVTVAWLAMRLPTGNAWYGPFAATQIGLTRTADGERTFQLSRGENAWHRVVSYWHMQVSGLSLSMPEADFRAGEIDLATLPGHLRPGDIDELRMQAWYHEVGWPAPALACSVHWRRQISNSNVTYTVRGGLQLPRDANFNPRALPLTPVWPGFAANTLLFAMVAAGGWLVVRGIRAQRRAKKGQCTRCRYPRAGLAPDAPCPECGDVPRPDLTPASSSADPAAANAPAPGTPRGAPPSR